ncbi:MAG TPA: N-6 DNA methylase [Nannocystaceae bacterium]|nr:N-6 DNA methylase [Nannocystaceae bacterium]
MAAKRRAKARESQLAFEALSIEGGLLSPEWLSKVAQLQAGTQAEADYRVPKGLNLRDEIGRYWRIAQAHWGDYTAGRTAKADAKATAARFVLALLRDAFGFTALVPVEPAVLQERTYPVGHATPGGRVPVVVAPADSGLDTLSPAFGDGTRRRSAFGLAQEYLNAQEGALWGIASDGASLRIMRDNASLTRPAWIEADLQRIFTEERYADFAALWLLCHETRFGREGQPVTECALETWRSAGRGEGTRAREHLRRGVEDALVALGQGFLSHPENAALRGDLQNGALPVKDYFNQLLRLVYRLIFLLTVEERGLLHPDGTSDATKALYANGYGIRRLRERSVKRSAHDRFADLWEATKVVCRGLAVGEPRLGLPALAGIFATNQCPALDGAKLENRALLLAVFKLAWLREDGNLARVNWRDMGPEELGSVYESLLELVPQIAETGRQFRFAQGGETKGNARKTTGSYYTPDSLVQVLLDSALEPVIADTIAKNPRNAVEALLGLSIVDPACGSGHFLLAAARRLAAHVARLQANGTPSAAEYRHALRQVVGRCIFGVDLNPMAVELCKVGLWMEAVEPGLPLTFLNSHIQHGNALLGTTPELMAKGIPDAAWDPIEGDDKKTASALKKRNKKAAAGQRSLDTLWITPADTEAQTVTRAITELDAASDADVEALAKKEERWDGILGSPEYRHQKFVADAWCAAFVWPKQPGELADAAPTNELWRQIRDGQGKAPALTTTTVEELASQYRFFHWHLQFPQVFAKGGFDVVLGNPPWERVKLQEAEWFAAKRPDIAMAPNASARKKLIASLIHDEPQLHEEFRTAVRTAEGESAILRTSARFPLCGRGDINSYAVFAETFYTIARTTSGCGLIVPSGILADDTTKLFFKEIQQTRALTQAIDFENNETLFPGVGHGRMRFCLLTIRKGSATGAARLFFLARGVADLADQERWFTLGATDAATINPNSETCPVFLSRRDAELTRATYLRFPIFRKEDGPGGAANSPWGARLHPLFHMTLDGDMLRPGQALVAEGWAKNGRDFVRESERMLPIIEGKMVTFYDHRAAHIRLNPDAPSRQQQTEDTTDQEKSSPDFFPDAYLWAPSDESLKRFKSAAGQSWAIAFKRVTSATNWRTLVACVVSDTLAISYTLYVLGIGEEHRAEQHCLLATLNSFAYDYFVRQKTMQPSLPIGPVYETVTPPPESFAGKPAWAAEPFSRWIAARVGELVCVSTDLVEFARATLGREAVFRWSPERRELLQAELDAALFHHFGMSRQDVEHVLATFPKVRDYDQKQHGEFRTALTILTIFDEMAAAACSGTSYQTRLSPPPADPRVEYTREGGKVLPFRPAVRPQPAIQPAAVVAPPPRRDVPAWSPDLLPEVATKTGLAASAGRWGTTLTGVDLGIAALAAVLRNLGGPASRDEVERAVVLTILPSLLQLKFDAQAAPKWRRAIGAANMRLTSVSALSIPWAEVLRRATVEHLLEMDADGRWRAGADIDDAPSDVLDARALVSLSWLASVTDAAVDDAELVAQIGVLRVAQS